MYSEIVQLIEIWRIKNGEERKREIGTEGNTGVYIDADCGAEGDSGECLGQI